MGRLYCRRSVARSEVVCSASVEPIDDAGALVRAVVVRVEGGASAGVLVLPSPLPFAFCRGSLVVVGDDDDDDDDDGDDGDGTVADDPKCRSKKDIWYVGGSINSDSE